MAEMCWLNNQYRGILRAIQEMIPVQSEPGSIAAQNIGYSVQPYPLRAVNLFSARVRSLLATSACVIVLLISHIALADDNRINSPKRANVPSWADDAIWYQVFVARFANGRSENDPHKTRSWTSDWKQLHSDEKEPLRNNLYDRRYGGDLQGLQNKLAYLDELGINAIYLNPVFQADTQHKYDTSDHRHIDDSFGIEESRLQLSGETEAPTTWKFSASDRLFVDLLKEAHARNMRVMIDGVFNHVGQLFWAWKDVKENGRQSRYANWFAVKTWEPELTWDAWDGPNGRLVNFRQVEDGLDPDVEQYLFACVRRWMDPNGDGDPSDGVDGWRLDAAERVPHGFWRRFRKLVKSTNSNALIAGEIWPDPSDWMDGTQFDVVTNYPVGSAIIDLAMSSGPDAMKRTTITAWCDQIERLNSRFDQPTTFAMLNLLDSHDTTRAVTQLMGKELTDSTPFPESNIPGDLAFDQLKLAAFLQMTLPGAPMIYYGDEVGMFGANDPFCRAPMWWGEMNAPHHNQELLDEYRRMIALRAQLPELRGGEVDVILADDARRVFVFRRREGDRESLVVVNADATAHQIEFTTTKTSEWLELFHHSKPANGSGRNDSKKHLYTDNRGIISVRCEPVSGVLLRKKSPSLSPRAN